VKLRVFFASDGDCLLLTSSDDHRALIDGGRAGSFQELTWPVLRDLADSGEGLDLVVVSHIDDDHLSGILWLMKAVAAWAVHDFQVSDGNNPSFPEPAVQRPPDIKRFWHNSWRAQLGALAGPIQGLVTQVDEALQTSSVDLSNASKPTIDMVDALQGLAESIPTGLELLRIVDNDTPLNRNEPFQDLVLLQDPPKVVTLGQTELTVIGPAKKHLAKLRSDWRKWLDTEAGRKAADQEMDEAVAAAEIIVETDPERVTPPNRASITLLAEEDGRTCLLTGDAAEEEILEGLKAAGRIVDGHFQCNVVKVQHHGSEYNLSTKFAGTVLGDHYVFCADGNNRNPDPSVVKTIAETRHAEDPRPFTLHFNCSPERTLPTRRTALRAAIKEAKDAAGRHPEITVNVLGDSKPSFEIEV
jgi:beta-lactamase superfamily II metal-dependent hydrolase